MTRAFRNAHFKNVIMMWKFEQDLKSMWKTIFFFHSTPTTPAIIEGRARQNTYTKQNTTAHMQVTPSFNSDFFHYYFQFT